MSSKKALVITSIADDKHPVLNTYAKECKERDVEFIVIGDTKSPDNFYIEGCNFYNSKEQEGLMFELSKITPEKHYSRKNIGYLLAIHHGCNEIQETDDDNIPYESFWSEKNVENVALSFHDKGWLNVYSYFTDYFIWARGFPLEEIKKPKYNDLIMCPTYSPIQQGLANVNPDVDAIYRLTGNLPIDFRNGAYPLSLNVNTWHPFNSQNTYWFKEAFPLLYLPSYCSFRMTDIWRSFVAQRIAWECGWSIFYHEPTVWQERNEHNLMDDFTQEIEGYKNNYNICNELQALVLKKGKENIYDNLVFCYTHLVNIGIVDKKELTLLSAWITDLKTLNV